MGLIGEISIFSTSLKKQVAGRKVEYCVIVLSKIFVLRHRRFLFYFCSNVEPFYLNFGDSKSITYSPTSKRKSGFRLFSKYLGKTVMSFFSCKTPHSEYLCLSVHVYILMLLFTFILHLGYITIFLKAFPPSFK